MSYFLVMACGHTGYSPRWKDEMYCLECDRRMPVVDAEPALDSFYWCGDKIIVRDPNKPSVYAVYEVVKTATGYETPEEAFRTNFNPEEVSYAAPA